MRRLALVPLALAAVAGHAAPARAADALPPVEERCLAARMARADRFVAGRAGRVAYAIVVHGRTRARHGRDGFRTASLLKPVLLTAYLRRPDVARRALRADERALLGPLIRRSDDAAANRLVEELGATSITAATDVLGARDFALALPVWGLSRTSAVDGTRLLARLARAVPPRHLAYARRLLATVVPSQRWGVGRVVPRGWGLLMKGGWGSGTGAVNSQIARYERGPAVVLLAVMTESNPDHAYGSATIEGVARRLLLPQPCGPRR